MQSRYVARSFLRPIFTHLRASALILSVFSIFFTPIIVTAQVNNIWAFPGGPSASVAEQWGEMSRVEQADAVSPLPLVIDADPGVDDAVALAWLLTEIAADDVLGIVTVAGNTTVANATQNVKTILAQLQIDSIPVIEGAAAPLVQKLSSRGMLIHGRDGLWGRQMPPDAIAAMQPTTSTNVSAHEINAAEFYCTNAIQHPGATILALGPLTNVAQAIQNCPDDMAAYGRVVILGGAKHGGNTTPVAEFNFWQDPEAVDIVLNSGLNLEIVPLEGFTQLSFSQDDLASMANTNRPIFQYLLPAVSIYLGTQLQAGVVAASIPDLSATLYAIKGLGTSSPALVKIITAADMTRGQSLMGVGFAERVMLITDDEELSEIAVEAYAISTDPIFPDATYVNTRTMEILMREPSNTGVVLEIDEAEMRKIFSNFLFGTTDLSETPSGQPPLNGPDDSLFLPFVNGE